MRLPRLCLLLAAVFAASSSAVADTIHLLTGEVLIGEVKSADFSELTVQVVFPEDREMTLPAQQVAPETMYSVLTDRLPANASSRLDLADYCLRSGLYAHAIVEARRAAKLDETTSTRAKKIESTAWESIARALLEDAKTYVAIEEPVLARLYLQSLLSRYPDTEAASEAKKLLKKLPETADERPRPVVSDPKRKDAVRAKLVKARKHLEKADKRTSAMKRHFQPDKRDEHVLRRAEPYYRKAYVTLREAARSPTDEETLNEEIRKLAAIARSRLCRVYLELGSLYLARGSIQLAEENCKRACQVEPENQDSHGLHQRIIDARIALRFGT